MKIYQSHNQPIGGDQYGHRYAIIAQKSSPKECLAGEHLCYTTPEMIEVVRTAILDVHKLFIRRFPSREFITIDEINAMWFRKPIKDSCYGTDYGEGWIYSENCADLFDDAKKEICKLYEITFSRTPNSHELRFTLMSAIQSDDYIEFVSTHASRISIRQEDQWDFKTNGCGRYEPIARIMTDKVKVGPCLLCDDPVFAYDPGCLHDAGILDISFGYGSGRDTTSGRGFIHDYCSYVFSQKTTNRKINWYSDIHEKVREVDLDTYPKPDTTLKSLLEEYTYKEN